MRRHDSSSSSLTPLSSGPDAHSDEFDSRGQRSLQDDGLKKMTGIHSQVHQYPHQFPYPLSASPSSLAKEQRPPAHATAALAQTSTPPSNRFLGQESIHSGRGQNHLLNGPQGQHFLSYPSDTYPSSVSPSSSAPYMAHQDFSGGLMSHTAMQATAPSYASFRGGPGTGMNQPVNLDGSAAYGQLIGPTYSTGDVGRHDTRRVSSTGTTAASQYWQSADLIQPAQISFSSSSATSGRGGSASSSWDSRPHTAEEAPGHSVLYGEDPSGTASEVNRDFHFAPLHERGWSSSSFDSVSPGSGAVPGQYFGGGGPAMQSRDAHSNMGSLNSSTRLAVSQHSVPSSSHARSGSEWSSSPTLDGEWTAERKKRPRRKFSEIDRMYKCAYRDCDRGYGTLNHLNAHVHLHHHGPKRTAEEFREIRREWRARRKEEARIKEREQAEQEPSQQTAGHHSASSHDDRPQPSPRTLRLPQASISRPRGNTSSSGSSSNVARQSTQVRPGRSASGPTPMSGTGGEVMLSPYTGLSHSGPALFPPIPASISSGSSWSSQGSAPGAYQALPRMPPSAYHFPLPLNLPGPEPPASGGVAPQSIALPSTARPDPNTVYQQDRGSYGGAPETERYQAYSSNPSFKEDQSSGGWEGGRIDFPHNSSGRRV